MTKVTTITEYTRDTDEGVIVVVDAFNDLGFSGTLEIGFEEAKITMKTPEVMEWSEHPEDAMIQFLAQFFEF